MSSYQVDAATAQSVALFYRCGFVALSCLIAVVIGSYFLSLSHSRRPR